MTEPLVSIICTCYNHQSFVKEALMSVKRQSYPNIELIVIDDHSADNSADVIKQFWAANPETQVIINENKIGLCKNFNHGLSLSRGQYLIDLSADDILMERRVELQVRFFESLSQEYGVIYSNAQLIRESGELAGHFYPPGEDERVITTPPEGDIYQTLIESCVIPTQTMMMRRSVLEDLKGYDENLAYEDFDFWIRSSRNWKYGFQDEILTKIRQTTGSLSSKQYDKDDDQLMSTYVVCEKIRDLNKSEEENRSLAKRLRYELMHAVMAEKRNEAKLFYQLLCQTDKPSFTDKSLNKANELGISTAWLRNTFKNL